jgi:MFS family permease
MVIGGLWNATWIIQFIIPSMRNRDILMGENVSSLWYFSDSFYYTLNMVISIISGFLSTILWVAEGKYITECATEETKGFYFSYFWAFYMASQCIGNLIAGIIIGSLNQVIYFYIMSGLSILASISFAFLGSPEKEN